MLFVPSFISSFAHCTLCCTSPLAHFSSTQPRQKIRVDASLHRHHTLHVCISETYLFGNIVCMLCICEIFVWLKLSVWICMHCVDCSTAADAHRHTCRAQPLREHETLPSSLLSHRHCSDTSHVSPQKD